MCEVIALANFYLILDIEKIEKENWKATRLARLEEEAQKEKLTTIPSYNKPDDEEVIMVNVPPRWTMIDYCICLTMGEFLLGYNQPIIWLL